MRAVSIVHHRVADYDAWKAVYDGVADMQRAGGVLDHAVLRSADDPNMVVVVHTFASQEAAHAFFADNPDLKAAMGSAGVDFDSFQVEFLDEVAAGRLAEPASA
jgi:heme-degrading monooxygenase HmoA